MGNLESARPVFCWMLLSSELKEEYRLVRELKSINSLEKKGFLFKPSVFLLFSLRPFLDDPELQSFLLLCVSGGRLNHQGRCKGILPFLSLRPCLSIVREKWQNVSFAVTLRPLPSVWAEVRSFPAFFCEAISKEGISCFCEKADFHKLKEGDGNFLPFISLFVSVTHVFPSYEFNSGLA